MIALFFGVLIGIVTNYLYDQLRPHIPDIPYIKKKDHSDHNNNHSRSIHRDTDISNDKE